ncbi:unnamed protein product [Paramecium octaurelia]|uniref:Uncharacterized protein n=1 Tax=Paramecium octaurelia TaxID=43137 RepID=A0A8S1W2W6_PAROT|nr:unnamed protein product [Paramecium octaurelia]
MIKIIVFQFVKFKILNDLSFNSGHRGYFLYHIAGFVLGQGYFPNQCCSTNQSCQTADSYFTLTQLNQLAIRYIIPKTIFIANAFLLVSRHTIVRNQDIIKKIVIFLYSTNLADPLILGYHLISSQIYLQQKHVGEMLKQKYMVIKGSINFYNYFDLLSIKVEQLLISVTGSCGTKIG